MNEEDALILLLTESRKRRGYTVPGLAKRAGVGRIQMNRWERRVSWPTAENLAAWAGALGVPIPPSLARRPLRDGGRPWAPCPSRLAYQRHKRRGEDSEMCGCTQANRDYTNAYRKAKRGG